MNSSMEFPIIMCTIKRAQGFIEVPKAARGHATFIEHNESIEIQMQ